MTSKPLQPGCPPPPFLIYFVARAPIGPRPLHCRSFYIKHRSTFVGRTPLNEGSVCRRDLYLTTRNNRKRQVSILLARFEPAIPASERPHTHALDRSATGTSTSCIMQQNIQIFDKPLALIRSPEQSLKTVSVEAVCDLP